MAKEMSTPIDFNKLLSISKWSPLSSVFGRVDHDSFISEYLYRIMGGVYFIVSPYSGLGLNRVMGEVFITGVGFAGGDGAALHAFNGEIERDDGAPLSRDGFNFLGHIGRTYHEISSHIENNNYKVSNEFGVYRISTDGAFVHRVIETELSVFYFRGNDCDADELPYAVLLKLTAG